ncbi:hypothetical protein KC19_8G060900 [Ceratodon purpureus]|uniref:Uncharacterized protein n=1 Tax=Ceratodon purpureus TaxID=3225 RepID=A0A8T0GXR6_CERPU|nr:hypothetical protein KC19_8G060900 [Ceratodon purpureus]
MLASPGKSPRHIVLVPSPSPSTGASRSDGALATRSASDRGLEFFALPRKRKSAQVPLDEDSYVAAIEKIIERDYFPGVGELRDRVEWMEVVRSGEHAMIRDVEMEIGRRRRVRAREDGTPAVSVLNTPASMVSGQSHEDGGAVNTNLKLDEFLRKYTSEDNASFSRILDKENQERKKRYEKGVVDPNLRIEHANDRVTDGFGTSNQPLATLETWKYRAKNQLMYDSAEQEDAPFTQTEKKELDQGPPKSIATENTRFREELFDSEEREDVNTVAAWPSAERETNSRARNDYRYVATPSPAPGVDESPFMTWGQIAGTPLRLETDDTRGVIGGNGEGVPHFKIPAPSARDAKAHALSRDAGGRLREKAKLHSPCTPLPPRSWSGAAQKLVNKNVANSWSSSVDARLRASYGSPLIAPGMFVRSRQGRENSLPPRSPYVPRSMP